MADTNEPMPGASGDHSHDSGGDQSRGPSGPGEHPARGSGRSGGRPPFLRAAGAPGSQGRAEEVAGSGEPGTARPGTPPADAGGTPSEAGAAEARLTAHDLEIEFIRRGMFGEEGSTERTSRVALIETLFTSGASAEAVADAALVAGWVNTRVLSELLDGAGRRDLIGPVCNIVEEFVATNSSEEEQASGEPDHPDHSISDRRRPDPARPARRASEAGAPRRITSEMFKEMMGGDDLVGELDPEVRQKLEAAVGTILDPDKSPEEIAKAVMDNDFPPDVLFALMTVNKFSQEKGDAVKEILDKPENDYIRKFITKIEEKPESGEEPNPAMEMSVALQGIIRELQSNLATATEGTEEEMAAARAAGALAAPQAMGKIRTLIENLKDPKKVIKGVSVGFVWLLIAAALAYVGGLNVVCGQASRQGQ